MITSSESAARSFKGGEGILDMGKNDELVDNGFLGSSPMKLPKADREAHEAAAALGVICGRPF